MTERDYREWVAYHTACLPSIASWFENHEDKSIVHASWMKALSEISLADACAATDAMVAGTLDRPFPEETPATVRRFAVELALSRREKKPEPDGNGRYCELCRNTGLVTIWHPLVARGVHQGIDVFRAPDGTAFRICEEGVNGDVKPLKAVAPCNCSMGDKFATKMVKKGDHWEPEEVRRYSPAHFHARVQDRSRTELAEMTRRQRVIADMEEAGIGGGVF